MSLTQQHRQEQINRAYVNAIAGFAGVNLYITREQDYGIDGSFRSVTITQNIKGENVRYETGYALDFQLKSSVNCIIGRNDVRYDCEVDAYNKIVSQNGRDGATSCLPLVLYLPKEESEWLTVTEDALTLRKACYWRSLTGAQTLNKKTSRVAIPRSQLFTPQALRDIMERIERREAI